MLNNQRVGCNFSHFFHPVGSSVDPSGMVMQLTVHIIVTLGGSKPVENARASKRPRNVVLVADSPRTQLTSILEYFRCVMMCLDGIMMNCWILGSPKQFSDNSNSSFFGSRWTLSEVSITLKAPAEQNLFRWIQNQFRYVSVLNITGKTWNRQCSNSLLPFKQTHFFHSWLDGSYPQWYTHHYPSEQVTIMPKALSKAFYLDPNGRRPATAHHGGAGQRGHYFVYSNYTAIKSQALLRSQTMEMFTIHTTNGANCVCTYLYIYVYMY